MYLNVPAEVHHEGEEKRGLSLVVCGEMGKSRKGGISGVKGAWLFLTNPARARGLILGEQATQYHAHVDESGHLPVSFHSSGRILLSLRRRPS